MLHCQDRKYLIVNKRPHIVTFPWALPLTNSHSSFKHIWYYLLTPLPKKTFSPLLWNASASPLPVRVLLVPLTSNHNTAPHRLSQSDILYHLLPMKLLKNQSHTALRHCWENVNHVFFYHLLMHIFLSWISNRLKFSEGQENVLTAHCLAQLNCHGERCSTPMPSHTVATGYWR